jgi:hypothetical protein
VRSIAAAVLLVACSTAHAHWQSRSLQPLTVGWQQFFRVQWGSGEFRGRPIVEGYVSNVWGFWARDVQLLVTGYDATGTMVGQLVGWGPSRIPPGGRVYFTLPVPPAPAYEVAIFAWTWILDDDRREFDLRW